MSQIYVYLRSLILALSKNKKTNADHIAPHSDDGFSTLKENNCLYFIIFPSILLDYISQTFKIFRTFGWKRNILNKIKC